MNKHIVLVFQTLSKKQFELQNIRQLLCQQVQFSPSTAYNYIVHDNYSQSIDIYALTGLLGEERNISALESVLKYYSNNDLELGLPHFQAMILTREDQLVKKLTKQRLFSEDTVLPNYLVNYCKRLWTIEEQLHSQLNLFKAKSSPQLANRLNTFKACEYVDEQALKQAYMAATEHSCEQCPQISFELALRYLKVDSQSIPFKKLISLFIPQSCNTIKQFLSNQQQAYGKQKSKPKPRNPYIHRQFSKLKNKGQNQHFCFREIQSVQTHLIRGKNMPSNVSIKQKMSSYSVKLINQLQRYFKIINKIIKLTIAAIEAKDELIRSFDCTFGLLFKQIAQSQYLVPSELQHYLNRIGINLRVEDLFILFKKYGDPLNGKLNMNRFVKIFACNCPISQRKGLGLINPTFRTASIACLLEQIKQELKIQALKQKIVQQLQIRQIFDGLDPDRNGKLSRTDLQIVYKKITGTKLQERQVEVLWSRMGKSLNEYINYDTFMFEMLPKLKKRPKLQKTSGSFRN